MIVLQADMFGDSHYFTLDKRSPTTPATRS
jgi:hypothetical protein